MRPIYRTELKFTHEMFSSVSVYEPESDTLDNILLTIGEGANFETIAVDRVGARRLIALLEDAIAIDQASFAPVEGEAE